MKLKRIKLLNVGPYVGDNIIEFNIDDKDRNITLIGGKNGAGKTTLFSSIKACLYGYKAYGYESASRGYLEEIYKLININIKSTQGGKASVEIDLLVDDGKYNHTFVIIREWEIRDQIIAETECILKNGNAISGDEINNFKLYLDNMIPPELFNFYFFDGEKIGDYFLSGDSSQNFKNAFLTLCGLDSISIMVKNFERIYKKKIYNTNALNEYNAALGLLATQEERLAEVINLHNTAKLSVESAQSMLVSLEETYSVSGGLSLDEWKKIQKQIIEEEGVRSDLNRKIKDIALDYLPFLIVKEQLIELLKQIELEKGSEKLDTLKSTLFNEEVERYLENVVKDNFDVKDILLGIYGIFKKEDSIIDESAAILDLSKEDTIRLTTQIEDKLLFDKQEITKIIKGIKKSINRSKKCRNKLEANNVENMEEFNNNKISLTKTIVSNQLLVDKYELEKAGVCLALEKASGICEKAKKNYELELKSRSISDIATRSFMVYKDIEEKLICKYAELLEDKFIENFNSIINKVKFIDGINIDLKLNVRPYKNVLMKKSDIESMMASYGASYLLDVLGIRSQDDVVSAINSDKDDVLIPVIIKSEFSQGEKQVYIMSLYISLLEIANVNVPFIIDTPFARIDSEHRGKIVDNFFKKTRSQVLILSTDEEIVGDYKSRMSDKLANVLMLKSISHGHTSIIKNKYFEEKK